MALVVANIVADGQVFCMAVSSCAQWFDVFQCGGRGQHMLSTDPARHNTMHLASHGPVNFVAGMGEFAHGTNCTALHGKHLKKNTVQFEDLAAHGVSALARPTPPVQ